MSSQKGGFKQKFYEDIAPVATGVGASIVIVGALFKIQHYPGASLMLILGLGTEALLFLMFAFAPKPKHEVGLEDWAKIYPQLVEDDWEDEYEEEGEEATSENLAKSLNDMMDDAGISSATINSLGSGLKGLTDSVNKMSDLSDAAVASDTYAKEAKSAAESLKAVGKSYATTAEAMQGMSAAATDAAEYHKEVQNITKNLGSLNAVYEMELQDANNHLKAMNKFYSNLSTAMDNMSEASKDTAQFKQQLADLSSNLTQLNTIYGSMLTAMKG